MDVGTLGQPFLAKAKFHAPLTDPTAELASWRGDRGLRHPPSPYVLELLFQRLNFWVIYTQVVYLLLRSGIQPENPPRLGQENQMVQPRRALYLAAFLASGLALAACGSSPSNDPTAQPPSVAPAPVVSSPAGPVYNENAQA